MLLLAKVTLLFLAAQVTLFVSKRSAAVRHLLCVCALVGSLILSAAALFPERVITVRLPAIHTVAIPGALARAANWSPSALLLDFWAFGGFVLIFRLIVGQWHTERLVRAATLIERDDLFLADVSVPIVCRLFRPAVLMPRSSSEWPDWQFDAAVRHERMHVRRRDLWTNLIAQLACAAWWFHPLAWLLYRQLRDSQETACDDAVLFSGFEPATYAEALLAVAQTSTSALLQGCPMTTQTNLKTRIARLFDRAIARTTSRTNFLRIGIGFAIVITAIGMLSPLKSRAQFEPRPNAARQVYKAGGNVSLPRVLYKVDPAYTEDARRDRVSGAVLLSVVVGADGLAHDVSIQRSLDAGLDRSAAEAVQQWRFAPGTLKGKPVAVQATIEINFRLL